MMPGLREHKVRSNPLVSMSQNTLTYRVLTFLVV